MVGLWSGVASTPEIAETCSFLPIPPTGGYSGWRPLQPAEQKVEANPIRPFSERPAKDGVYEVIPGAQTRAKATFSRFYAGQWYVWAPTKKEALWADRTSAEIGNTDLWKG